MNEKLRDILRRIEDRERELFDELCEAIRLCEPNRYGLSETLPVIESRVEFISQFAKLRKRLLNRQHSISQVLDNYGKEPQLEYLPPLPEVEDD